MRRSAEHVLILMALTLLAACQPVARPGLRSDGSVLLPNQWTLTPTGEQIPVGDLPLAMALSPDGRYLLVTNNGYADQYVSVIDVALRHEIGKIPMSESWLGLAFSPTGDRVYVSGGGTDEIAVQRFDRGTFEQERTLRAKADGDEAPYFVSGLAVSGDGRTLYACALRQSKLMVFDLESEDAVPAYVDVGAFPYTVVLDEKAGRGFVSNWGDRSISVIDLATRRESRRIAVGDHPNAMVVSPDTRRLYVTSANSNELSVIDLDGLTVTSVVDLSPYPDAPPSGSTPNGLALSPDAKSLYIANADNNSITVLDLTGPTPRFAGWIPTGWYPTAALTSADGKTLFVANGKGLGSRANPGGPQPTDTKRSLEYIGQLFLGTVAVVPVPERDALARMTAQVRQNNGFKVPAGQTAPAAPVQARAIPRHLGEPSLIKHVFYILKENRSYDQVFGDLPQGEGDPSLTLFGREISPNHHALAETFVLFDNFYVDAEVSQDGHSWSMGAYATDFTEKLWPTNYSGRNFPQPLYLPIAYPTAGFLWDASAAAGVTYRSYGEFARRMEDGTSGSPLPALNGHVAPHYPILDLTIRDQARADAFAADLEQLIADDSVPALNILSLPSDHTMGTRPGAPTPRAMMADNDLALGRIIDTISHSPIWKESVVFVIEDDSQNGPDHIDAHRTVALIASPYAKRGFVDHTMYDTVSLVRTLELILGIPPMSQYDAAAIPMFAPFTDRPDPTPFDALPARWQMDERNTEQSPGAALSARMNFDDLDAAPERLLNEIIWKSVRGADSEMPQPHTRRNWLADADDDAENGD